MKEENHGFVIQCPFCSDPYTAEMVAAVEEGGGGCDTCGPESADVKIEVFCSNCKRLIYKKEGKSYDF